MPKKLKLVFTNKFLNRNPHVVNMMVFDDYKVANNVVWATIELAMLIIEFERMNPEKTVQYAKCLNGEGDWGGESVRGVHRTPSRLIMPFQNIIADFAGEGSESDFMYYSSSDTTDTSDSSSYDSGCSITDFSLFYENFRQKKFICPFAKEFTLFSGLSMIDHYMTEKFTWADNFLWDIKCVQINEDSVARIYAYSVEGAMPNRTYPCAQATIKLMFYVCVPLSPANDCRVSIKFFIEGIPKEFMPSYNDNVTGSAIRKVIKNKLATYCLLRIDPSEEDLGKERSKLIDARRLWEEQKAAIDFSDQLFTAKDYIDKLGIDLNFQSDAKPEIHLSAGRRGAPQWTHFLDICESLGVDGSFM